jgi:integrase
MASFGTIYKRKRRQPDGIIVEFPTWWIQFYVDGKKVRQSAKTTDRKEALRLLKVRAADVAQGNFLGLGPERIRFRDLAEDLVADYQQHRRSSLPQLVSRLEKHLLRAFGDIRAADFTTRHIERYKQKRLFQGAAFSTIDRELEIARRAFKLAADCDPPRVARVPKFRFYRIENIRTGFLEESNYLTLRDAMPNPERLLLVLGYHTGIRLGVLRQLLWYWVNLEHKRITIPSGVDKNKQPRVVPIYGDMGPYLEMAFATRKATFPQCPYVVQRYGHKVVDISKAWAKGCQAAGLEGLRFHDLRRSAVRNMDRAGVPRDVAMRIIGHKTASMFRRYNIISDRDLDNAGLKLESYRERQQARRQPTDSPSKRVN